MKEIDIFNYDNNDVKDKIYDEAVKLIINKSSYSEDTKKVKVSKQSTISFQNVKFNSEVSIHKDDGIDDEIVVNFFNCSIDSFTEFALKSKNAHLFFGGCLILNLRLQSKRLKSVKFNNCFGTFFINNLNKVDIVYTESNIYVKDWVNAIPTKVKLKQLLSYETSFHLEDIENINFFCNEIGEEKREELAKNKVLRTNGKYKNFLIDRFERRKNSLRRYLSIEEKSYLNLNLHIKYSVDFNHNKTTVRNSKLNSISLSGRPKGEVLIEECKVDDFYLRDFSPQDVFTLYNIQKRKKTDKGKFEIHNCNLDNARFSLVNLNQYFVVFHKSSFVGTKFYYTIFPNIKKLISSNDFASIKNIHYPNEKSKTYNREMYELFLELKQALNKRGNVYESQKMKAVSHDFLFKISSINPFTSSFYNDTLVLILNRVSNFHGISIRNAFFFILITILSFYGFLLISYESYVIGISSCKESTNIIFNNMKYLFVIANPTHRISSLAPENEITTATYIVSFFSRIFVGYAYYQFIATFRRFGK